MKKLNAIDMHCDTLMKAYLNHGDQSDVYDLEGTMVNVKRLLQGNALAQFFAIFIVPQDFYKRMERPAISDEEYEIAMKDLERTEMKNILPAAPKFLKTLWPATLTSLHGRSMLLILNAMPRPESSACCFPWRMALLSRAKWRIWTASIRWACVL